MPLPFMRASAAALAAALGLGVAAAAPPLDILDDDPTISVEEVTLSDAVLHTLNENPGVQSLKEVAEEARGVARSARGQFDWTAELRTSAREDVDQLTQTEQLTALVSGSSVDRERREFLARATRRDRNGLVVQPFVRLTDLPDRVGAPSNVGRSEAGVSVIIPLLRGKGHLATVNLRAARKNLEAAELRVLHQISLQVLQTVLAYNNCLAARQSEVLTRDILARAEALLADAKDRITAGMLEPAFIHQAEAKLANNQSDLINVRNRLYGARQFLGLTMGISPAELIDAPMSGGAFPEVESSSRLSEIDRAKILELAEEMRLDYQSALATTTTQDIRLQGDIDQIRPLIDLRLQASYNGISQDTSFWSRQTDSLSNGDGPSRGAFLSFQFPLGNNGVKGRVDSRKATIRRLEGSAESLLRRLSSGALTQIEAVRNAALLYELVQEAERDFLQAVEFEQGKYRSGNSRLNLVILLEDQYIRARLAVIEAIRRYSNAMAQLKFETGTLLRLEGENVIFRSEDLYKVQG